MKSRSKKHCVLGLLAGLGISAFWNERAMAEESAEQLDALDPKAALVKADALVAQDLSPKGLLKMTRTPASRLQRDMLTPLSERAFLALLNHPVNREKAKVFWFAASEKAWPRYRMENGEMVRKAPSWLPQFDQGLSQASLFLTRRVALEGLKSAARILVVMHHPLASIPGNGTLLCFWFQEDGTLEGADLLTTGHRQELVLMNIDPNMEDMGDDEFCGEPPFREPSELQLICREWIGKGKPAIARLRLGKNGLRLIEVRRVNGEKDSQTDIGTSLLGEKR